MCMCLEETENEGRHSLTSFADSDQISISSLDFSS